MKLLRILTDLIFPGSSAAFAYAGVQDLQFRRRSDVKEKDLSSIVLAKSVIGGLFGGTPKPAPIQPPAVMPIPDDQAVMAAKRKQAAAMQERSGRASTIFNDTAGNDKLGG